MNWNFFEGKLIINVFYFDEENEIGKYYPSQELHFLQWGSIYLEIENGDWFWLKRAEEGGLDIVEETPIKGFKNNKIDLFRDRIWSSVSQMKIRKIHKINTDTIKIEFWNGENLFFSNAGFVNENTIGENDDLVIYSKRNVGERHKLI